MIFYITLVIGSLWLVFVLQNYTEDEIIKIFQSETGSAKAKRNRGIYVTIILFLGKNGFFMFFILAGFIILKYYFLPTLRKFLSKEGEEE